MTQPTSTSTTATGSDPVIDVEARLVGEVIGEEYVADIDIGADTSFSGDLEMESIEFVALAEALQLHFGERVNFVAWLAELELDDLIAMTVGQVATFIEGCIAS